MHLGEGGMNGSKGQHNCKWCTDKGVRTEKEKWQREILKALFFLSIFVMQALKLPFDAALKSRDDKIDWFQLARSHGRLEED